MKHRLRKKDRIKQAGKGCNTAQYVSGTPKRKDKKFFQDHKTPEMRRSETERWVAANTPKPLQQQR